MKFKACLVAFCLGLARDTRGSGIVGASSSAFVNIFYPAENSLEISQVLDGLGPMGTAEQVGFLVDSLMKTEDGKGGGLGDFAKTLKKLVASLKEQVNKSHSTNEGEVAKSQEAVEKCRGLGWQMNSGSVNSKDAAAAKKNYKDLNRNFTKCSAEKKPLQDQLDLCKGTVETLKSIKKSSCENFDAADKLPATMATACKVSPLDTSEAVWVKRMKQYLSAELVSIKDMKTGCEKATKKVQAQQGECDGQQGKVNSKAKECGAPANRLQAKCMWLTTVQLMCSSYQECYNRQVSSYNALKELTKKKVATRKLQWRMLERLACLAGAFDLESQEARKAKLDACAGNGVYKTDHLDIDCLDVTAGDCSGKLPDDVDTADCAS